MQKRRWLGCSLFLLLMAACGQRGPLYLPEQPPENPEQPQPESSN
ncbi:MAG: lipoprotein [Pseudomonadota bacterium]